VITAGAGNVNRLAETLVRGPEGEETVE